MPSASDATVFARWQTEAEKHWRAGDYDWMAAQIDVGRGLEIGCGAGYGTLVLAQRGVELMTLEPDAACRATTCNRLAAAGAANVHFVAAEVGALDAAMLAEIGGFAPQWIVCWLMGTGDSAAGAPLLQAEAVRQHREAVHRQVAELAARLPSVRLVHLVDRTAFPWKIKDTARETLVAYHAATTFAGLPFSFERKDALYRRLDERQWAPPAGAGRMTGVVAVLGSLCARRMV